MKRTGTIAAAASLAALALAGCSGTAETQAGGSSTGSASPSAAPAAASAVFGPACTAAPASGAGSLTDLASDPVATAAAKNPALSTLVMAVQKAGLAQTLNQAEAITVFAPTNDAFAKLPKATLSQVLANKDTLRKILTYHVVSERRTPADLAAGSLATLEGGTLTTKKNGDTYAVNDAQVVCGNVQTRNATVYLIDSVLIPNS